MHPHTFFAFNLALLSTTSIFTAQYVNIKPQPKTIVACAAVGAASYGLYKLARVYTKHQSHYSVQRHHDLYDKLIKNYPRFSYTEDELAQTYINKNFHNTLSIFHTQVQQDRLQFERSYHACKHACTDQNVLNNSQQLIQNLTTLEALLMLAQSTLDLRALMWRYQQELLCTVQEPQAIHAQICKKYPKTPYPYVYYYDALSCALSTLADAQKKVAPEHHILKESEDLYQNLENLRTYIASQEAFRQQQIQCEESEQSRKRSDTFRQHTKAQQQQAHALASINKNLQELVALHEHELTLTQQQLETFKFLMPQLNCSHIACAEKIQIMKSLLDAQLPHIQHATTLVARQQRELKAVKTLQENNHQNAYTALASLQEQINRLKQQNQNSSNATAPSAPLAMQNKSMYPEMNILQPEQPGELP